MTFVNTLVTAAKELLDGVAPVVDRVRLRPQSATTTKAVSVRPGAAEVFDAPEISGYPYAWDASLVVDCYARPAADEALDEAVDPLLADVYARLMADLTLGGRVVTLQPHSLSYDFDVDGGKAVCATLTFIARLRQSGSTL